MKMLLVAIISLLFAVNALCLYDDVNQSADENKIFVYSRHKYDELINITVNSTTDYYLDFIEDTNHWMGYPTRVHVSTNDNVSSDHPLFITATQQKGISSWELPLVVTTESSVLHFNDVSRTLCPHDAGPNVTSINRPTLQVTTSSEVNITTVIKLRRVRDFFVQVDKELNTTVKPSTPKYYYFSFDSTPQNVTVGERWRYFMRFNYTIPKSVILMIESDDTICATVSIQNNSCPVFDNERDVLYQGYYLTMTTKGGITLTQSMFPYGFYIVFIVREQDDKCTRSSLDNSQAADPSPTAGDGSPADRVKQFRFRVMATISYKEYFLGAATTVALVVAIAIVVAVLPVLRPYDAAAAEETVIVEEEPGPSTTPQASTASATALINGHQWEEDSLSDSMPEWQSSSTRPLTVAGLSRSTAAAHARRTTRYFWSSLTVAVVYALPVVQLLFTYQRMVYSTGEQDLCYYNFLCAHPLGSLADFNHVWSNVGYVILGLVFLLQVSRTPVLDTGIPQHRGLLYSLGLALAMEGVLSACYHLCPNKMNFQFDSSFMYVMAVLCMVKLYQGRHADVNASAHATFMLIAVLMALGLIGILCPSMWWWAMFTILHLLTCLALTINIYYVGRIPLECGVIARAYRALREHGRAALRPTHGARAALLALANLANWTIAGYGLIEHKKDFARHLLAILMMNTLLYTTFYVVMKLVYRERMLLHSWLYLAGSLACFVLAGVYFLDSKTKWSESPAQSRQHNAVCSVLSFYDSHDVWHVCSAAAMFLYFNMLLTVDDALKHTPRHRIPAF